MAPFTCSTWHPGDAMYALARATVAPAGRVKGKRSRPSVTNQWACCQSVSDIGPVSNDAEAGADRTAVTIPIPAACSGATAGVHSAVHTKAVNGVRGFPLYSISLLAVPTTSPESQTGVDAPTLVTVIR